MSTCYIDTKALREEHDYHRISSTSYVCAKCAHDMCQHEPRPCEPLSLEDLRAGFILLRKKLFAAELVTDRLAALQSLCAQVYQAAGAFGMPERVLDVLSDAANGDPIRHANILPVDPPAHEARIAKLEQDNVRLRDALDHIMRAARRSRTQSRRLRWIEARARCALEGGEDWKDLDLPRFSESNQRYLKARIAELEEALASGGDQ